MNAMTARGLSVAAVVVVWTAISEIARVNLSLWPVTCLGCSLGRGRRCPRLQKTVAATISGVVWPSSRTALRERWETRTSCRRWSWGPRPSGWCWQAQLPVLSYTAGLRRRGRRDGAAGRQHRGRRSRGHRGSRSGRRWIRRRADRARIAPGPRVTKVRDAEARAASRRLLATSERELQRIVLDMHDGPVQDIFAALSQLQGARARARGGPHRRPARPPGRAAARACPRRDSQLHRRLPPPGFERRELGQIIEGLAVAAETLTEQAVELELPGAGRLRLPRKSRSTGSCRKRSRTATGIPGHAAARERRATGLSIALTVSDDGRGFEPQRVLARRKRTWAWRRALGLRGSATAWNAPAHVHAESRAPAGTSWTVRCRRMRRGS